MLDIEQIKQSTVEARKKSMANKNPSYKESELTVKDLEFIKFCSDDMEKSIEIFSSQGHFNFNYDCSKIPMPIFCEVAKKFKINNPRFYVEIHYGVQLIVVDWSGKIR